MLNTIVIIFLTIILGVVLHLNSDDLTSAEQPAVPPSEMSRVATRPNSALPQLEAQFCSIVETATSHYQALSRDRDAAKRQQNGIVVERIEHQMTQVRTARNEDVFQLLKQNNFTISNWLSTIVAINSPRENCYANIPSCISVDVQLPCAPVVIIHASIPANDMTLQLLSTRKQGDQLVMSGWIATRYGG